MKRNSLIFIGIVALLFSTTFYADENIEATKEYHEKYLKGKITPELKSDVAKNIKMEDFKTYKEFEPTLKYMNKLLTKDPYIEESEDNRFNINLHINPKVTQRYKIDRVPAIIYVQNHDGLLEDSVPVEESNEKYWISYGMGSIDYVVERINKEANSLWLTSLLEKDSFFRSKGGK